MTTAKDISIVGVTNHVSTDNAKHSGFLFEFNDKSCFGVVGFTGVYWQVAIYGGDMEYKTKEALRRKVARLNPNDYLVVNEDVEFFHKKGLVFNLASDKQINFLKNILMPSAPEVLHAPYVSEMISTLNFYKSVIVKKDPHYSKGLEAEIEQIQKDIEEFKSLDHRHKNQFDFMKEFRANFEPCYTIYDKGRKMAHDRAMAVKPKF